MILKSLRGKYFETVAHITLCGYFLTLSMRCREGKGGWAWWWWPSWWPSETLRVGGWIEEPEVAGAEQWGDATRTRVVSSPGYFTACSLGRASAYHADVGARLKKRCFECRRSVGLSFGMTEVAAGAWVGAVLGSLAVGLTGLAPLLFIPTQAAISTSQVGFWIFSTAGALVVITV